MVPTNEIMFSTLAEDVLIKAVELVVSRDDNTVTSWDILRAILLDKHNNAGVALRARLTSEEFNDLLGNANDGT